MQACSCCVVPLHPRTAERRVTAGKSCKLRRGYGRAGTGACSALPTRRDAGGRPRCYRHPSSGLPRRAAGARTWPHMQDFEVEAVFAIGLPNTSGTAPRGAPALDEAITRGSD